MIWISTEIIYEIFLQIYEGPMNDINEEYVYNSGGRLYRLIQNIGGYIMRIVRTMR